MADIFSSTPQQDLCGKVTGEAPISIGKAGEEPKLPTPQEKIGSLAWSGEVPAQKWMNFYTKVLTRFVKTGNLKINVSFEASPDGGVSEQQVDETKTSLRELGLNDETKKQIGGMYDLDGKRNRIS